MKYIDTMAIGTVGQTSSAIPHRQTSPPQTKENGNGYAETAIVRLTVPTFLPKLLNVAMLTIGTIEGLLAYPAIYL